MFENRELHMETVRGSWDREGAWLQWADQEMRGVNAVWSSRQAAQKYAVARWDKASFMVLECRFEACRYCLDEPGDPVT